ncbi:cutinase, partial [Mycena galopus ATCC 62051]
GTLESPSIGIIVGPPLEGNLQSALGAKTLTFAGVDYPADIAGFLEGGDPAGSKTMAQDTSASVLSSGYSQGGQLVHDSAKMFSASVLSHIEAAVIFMSMSQTDYIKEHRQQGDLDNGEPVQGVPAGNTDVIDHSGDDICL